MIRSDDWFDAPVVGRLGGYHVFLLVLLISSVSVSSTLSTNVESNNLSSRTREKIGDDMTTFLSPNGIYDDGRELQLDRITDPPSANDTVFFSNCDVATYYENITSVQGDNPLVWSRTDLVELIMKTHRNVIALSRIYDALIDIDGAPGTNGEFVKLLYAQETMESRPYSEQDTWEAERLWPANRGVTGETAFTDLHNMRPAVTRSVQSRKSMMYGECGTVEFADECVTPATRDTAADTSQDGKVWSPPVSTKGDIARALMYMEFRYRETEINLALTDCPPFGANMGYLSTLLQWHEADPVDDDERERNLRTCQGYQGNRNPFVDYPQIVNRFFDLPATLDYSTRLYDTCVNVITEAPTASPNDCAALEPGDVMFYGIDGDDPDGVGFLPLNTIKPDVELFMTTDAWVGDHFLSNEGTVKLVLPASGIAAGEAFGFGPVYGKTTAWETWEGLFNIGINGDNVFLYCELNDGKPNPIAGFTNTEGGWLEAGLSIEEYGSAHSALPNTLKKVGGVALPHFDNYKYIGPDEGDKAQLQEWVKDPNNWNGFDYGSSSSSVSPRMAMMQSVWGWMMVSLLLVSIPSLFSSS